MASVLNAVVQEMREFAVVKSKAVTALAEHEVSVERTSSVLCSCAHAHSACPRLRSRQTSKRLISRPSFSQHREGRQLAASEESLHWEALSRARKPEERPLIPMGSPI